MAHRERAEGNPRRPPGDRKSTRLNSSHVEISYAVFCLKKKKQEFSRDPGIKLLKWIRCVSESAGRARSELRHSGDPARFFNDAATTEIYTLSLHDALPISAPASR